ncbi:IS66 family transposase [Gluconobacter wancherniae]|uniref:IS66 family transposase n=1 Tax=Gluconobacter wancherniae TaxID=1307955 RepID=UPI0030973F0D
MMNREEVWRDRLVLFAESGLTRDGKVHLAACWAHPRRKFYELHQTGSPIATEVLTQIRALYESEVSLRGLPPNQRRTPRQEHSRPRVETLELWLRQKLALLPSRARLAEAIRYALNRWDDLARFIEDGCIDLDTNPVERTIRPVTLGCRNALFAGSEGGANRWAIVASLIETAKLNGIEPFGWLRDVLTRMIDGHPAARIS